MTQLQNQFINSPVKGDTDLKQNTTVISVQLDSSSAGGVVPGTCVTMVDSAGGVPKVVEAAADTDDIFGVVIRNLKNASYDALAPMEIAFARGTVVYLEAGAAIARNAEVGLVVAGSKVIAAASGKRVIGRALDKAAADGDLIRVIIDLPGSLVA